MNQIPIIIPIQTKRDCIVVQGEKYCESHNFSKKEIGILAFSVLGFVLWLILFFWLSDIDREKEAVIFLVILPLLITGLLFILL